MLNLYYKPSCPYCQRVLKANETIKAPLELRDVSLSEALQNELITKGGKRQVPFLEDTDEGVMMYESLDIIEYLAREYAGGTVPATLDTGNVCPID